MSDVTRLIRMRYGINADAYTIGVEPAAYTRLEPRSVPVSFFPRSRQPIERSLIVVDGRRLPRAHGVKDIAEVTVPLLMTGANSNTGAAVTDWEAKQEAGNLLSSVFGAPGVATTGAAPTVSSASGTALTASSSVLADNDIVLINTTSGWEARQIASGGGTTSLVLDRALVGTGVAASTIIRAARYVMSSSQTVHKPIWFDCEGENWRRQYDDCQPSSMAINIPNAGVVETDFTFMPNNWGDYAETNTGYVAPTTGSPIVSGASQFYIGSTAFMLRNARLTINLGMTMRETTTGINGVRGGLATNKTNIMLEGELYVGDSNGSVGNMIDDSGTPSVDAILGDSSLTGTVVSTYDVMLQVGSSAGAAMFIRIPAADIRSSGVREGGPFAVLPFQAMATGASPLTLGIF